MPHPPKWDDILAISSLEKPYWTGRAGDLGAGIVQSSLFLQKALCTWPFPTAADRADRIAGPISPLPCQEWHGYRVSIAHHGKVRGCRRAYERTALRGRPPLRRRRAP
jgi:hypothetical protein